LGGKVRHQLDLLFGEGTNLLAIKGERTDQFVLLQHWDSQNRPHPPKFDGSDDSPIAPFNVVLRCCYIGDVNHRFGRHHATDGRILSSKRRMLAKLGEGSRCIMRRNAVQGLAVPAIDISKLGVADAYGFGQHCFKLGSRSPGELLITWSTSDVAVCCSSASFVSLKSRVFSIAISAWSRKDSACAISAAPNILGRFPTSVSRPIHSPLRRSGK
jgi:hypothetical protein